MSSSLGPLPAGRSVGKAAAPHYNFTPVESAVAGGELQIVNDLEARPPDFVVGIPSMTARMCGFERFGAPGFGDSIMARIGSHYESTGARGEDAQAAARLGVGLVRLCVPSHTH